MLLQIKPTRWTCIATAFAMAVDIPVTYFLDALGHDGSDRINQLPDPLCRRGHHVQECVLSAMSLGYSVTPFELFPQAASVVPGQPPRVVHYRNLDADYNWFIFQNLVANTRGVITGVGRNCHHAVAYEHGRICDPDGRAYPYSREACERRGFYTQTLWRVERYAEHITLATEGQGDEAGEQTNLGTAENGATQ